MTSIEILGKNWMIALEQLPALLLGLRYTAIVSLASLAVAVVVGLGVSLMRLSSNKVVSTLAFSYIQVFRSLSVYVYILFIYFGFTALFDADIDPIGAAIIALSLLNSAYYAEIFRSAIASIDPGQREAALCLGMSRSKAFLGIVLPQAFRFSLPALVNQFTVIVKDSSIVGVIGVADTTYQATQLANVTYRQFEIFTVVGLIYIGVVLGLSALAGKLEQRLRRI